MASNKDRLPVIEHIDGESPTEYLQRAFKAADCKWWDLRVVPTFGFAVKGGTSEKGAYIEYLKREPGKRDKWCRLSMSIFGDDLETVFGMLGREIDTLRKGTP